MKLACLFLSVALLAGALAAPIPSSEFSDLTSGGQAMYDAVFKGAEPTKETLIKAAYLMRMEAEITHFENVDENIPKVSALRDILFEIEWNGFSATHSPKEVLERMATLNAVMGHYDASGKVTPKFANPQAQAMYTAMYEAALKGDLDQFSPKKPELVGVDMLEDSKGKEMSDAGARDTLADYTKSRRVFQDSFIDDEELLSAMYKVNQQTGFIEGMETAPEEKTQEEELAPEKETQDESEDASEEGESEEARRFPFFSRFREFFRG